MTQEMATIKYYELKFKQMQEEITALHKLVKEQDLKIIDLAFELEYAKRTDEWRKYAK